MSGFPAAFNTTRDEQPAYGQAGTASIPPGHGVVHRGREAVLGAQAVVHRQHRKTEGSQSQD